MADSSYKKYPEQEYFRPSVITVVIGVNNTVVWTNKDVTGSALHDVTSDQDLFKSSLLAPNESWSYTFTEAGEYKYHCQPGSVKLAARGTYTSYSEEPKS
jgi:plastocyanin